MKSEFWVRKSRVKRLLANARRQVREDTGQGDWERKWALGILRGIEELLEEQE